MWGRTAWRIAWRDLRSGIMPFAIAVAALAAGVGAMNAARALGAEFSARVIGDMRQWLAGGAVAVVRQAPSEEEAEGLARLSREGVEQTVALETLSAASSAQAADPALISIGIVD